MNRKVTIILIMVFAIFGMLDAGVLTLAKYFDSIAVLCGQDMDNSCNTVQNSAYSYLINNKNEVTGEGFQLPLTVAGLGFFTLLFVLAFILYRKEEKGEQVSSNFKWILFGSGLIGVLFSTAFTYIQAYLIEAFCTYCLISGFITVVIFGLLIYLNFFLKEEEVEKKVKKTRKSTKNKKNTKKN